MTILNWLLERMSHLASREAVLLDQTTHTYGDLLSCYETWRERLNEWGIRSGEAVSLEGDFSLEICGALLALIANGNIVVPLSTGIPTHRRELLNMSGVSKSFRWVGSSLHMETYHREIQHDLLRGIGSSGRPGLVLFSSGSSGKPKGIVHDLSKLLEKYKVRRDSFRTLSFLLFDHIGGFNTLFHTLSNGGTLISPKSRKPLDVCEAIEKYHIELLPSTPSFLNLLLISDLYKTFDLSSLKVITYGTEVMSEYTLSSLGNLFPWVQFRQTYGLSELGILRVRSKDSGSLWMKIGGEGIRTQVIDGILYIQSETAMEGYLNAPYPFDNEGWFNTQDQVISDGEYIRIVGRKSDIINVGGQKVYPAEVEDVLLQMPQIKDVMVTGRSHGLMGSVVEAFLNMHDDLNAKEMKLLIREFCKGKLEGYQIPVYVTIQDEELHSERFKKIRNLGR